MASYKIWVLGIALIIALLLIFPVKSIFETGVTIQQITKNTSEYNSGLRTGMIIQSINSQEINSVENYNLVIKNLFSKPLDEKGVRLNIVTSSEEFIFYTQEELSIIVKSPPKIGLKTGLDLSGGARALVKTVDVTLSYADTDSLMGIMNNRLNK